MFSFAIAILALAVNGGAKAQTYPIRPGIVIVPFAAGGPADITGRIVADIFSKALGQQFVVENVAGAGGQRARRAPRAPIRTAIRWRSATWARTRPRSP